ncbi:MAG: HipA domain-containing protein [Candidatus Nanopelagicales bacterium]|nr:HipA domain-containing protein [Candidatus Nanopelagicales bacterium]
MSVTDHGLDVWLGERLAGRLRAPDGRALEFEYDAHYRDAIDATPLSLSIPLARAEHLQGAVTNFFEALLPEQGAARERIELESGVSRSNVMGLLEYVGRDLPGAVCVVPVGQGLPSNGGVDRLSEVEFAERIADLRRSAAAGGLPLSQHGQWSLAGAQAKIALAYADGLWGIPFGAVPTTHIVKPAIPGFEQFDAFEVICLRAARRLGLSTAAAWLQPLVDGTHAAVVVRYDRLTSAEGQVQRIHQEDLCQALGYPAWQKYERDGGPGIRQIGSLLRRLPAHLRQSSAQRLFDGLAFNYAIAGTDGHARNFSLLLSGPDALLAPLYDLNSALPFTRPWGKRFDSVRKLHASFILGKSDAFVRVANDDWRVVAELLGIPTDYAIDRVTSIRDRTLTALEQSAEEVSAESQLVLDFDWNAAISGYRAASALAQ